MATGATDFPSDPPRVWACGQDDRLICRHVRRETHDVKTFMFAPATPGAFRFAAGQFLTFTFQIDGQPVSRCYTISSPPTRPDRVTITVKRVAGGSVSNWLHDMVRPGAAVSALGPMGAFTGGATDSASKYLFLSGGSGITPLMSMARASHDLGEEADIAFIHNARTPDDIIFGDELTMMARQSPRFRFSPICEADSPDEPWAGYRGRISLPLLRLIAPDFLQREIFTCGPTPYMAAVRGLLGEAGFDMARYHEESFVFEDVAPEPTPEVPVLSAATAFLVEFAKSNRVVTCDAGTTILAAARRAGLKLPSSCTRGICGTCKSGLVSGAVDMKHGGGIRQREIDRGQILICCSRPLTDLVIDR